MVNHEKLFFAFNPILEVTVIFDVDGCVVVLVEVCVVSCVAMFACDVVSLVRFGGDFVVSGWDVTAVMFLSRPCTLQRFVEQTP